MRIQHIIPVSGGKDSQAAICKAVERFSRRPTGNMPPRFVHADVGENEHELTKAHVAYLDEWLRGQLGVGIEIVRADLSAQIAYRRDHLEDEWSTEKTISRHSKECKELTEPMTWTERRDHRRGCSCKRTVLPALSPERIAEAKAVIEPTGDPMLDLALLKGRFSGIKSRFCTEELKLVPMNALKQPLWDEGVSTVEWIGERAAESKDRAKKPPIQRIRRAEGATQILYRPLFYMSAADVFEISERHGLKPNPLYLMGAKRVGCWPCAFCGKDELVNIANRTPEHIGRVRRYEEIASIASRHGDATFFPAADMPEGDKHPERCKIDDRIAWARCGRGGKQFDLYRSEQMFEADRDGAICDSAYGLCE